MGKHELGLRLIAIGKLVKVVTLVTVGITALTIAGHEPARGLTDLANSIGVDPGTRHLHWLAAKLSGVSTEHLEEIGFGSFVYASIFAVEGTGLWMKKQWAEYLTIVVTLSFIPLEIYEIARHENWRRIAMLVLNVIALAYLVWRVRWERRSSGTAQLGTAWR